MDAQTLDKRKLGIGGSDAGAVIGVSEYRTRLDVYLDKVGEAAPIEDNEPMFWGRVLEDAVAAVYAERSGDKIRRKGMTVSKDNPFMLANLDRVIVGDPRGVGVLEIKTAGAYSADQWGEPGSDQIPQSYYAQLAHYMAVTGYTWARLAVLIGGQDFRVYDIPRDEDLIQSLIDIERDFWVNHVEARVPPYPTTTADINKRWPTDSGATIIASTEHQDMVDRLRTVKARIKMLGEEKQTLEDDIKRYMEEASTMVGADGQTLCTWKSQLNRRLDQKAVRAALGDEVKTYEVTTKTRVLRIK